MTYLNSKKKYVDSRSYNLDSLSGTALSTAATTYSQEVELGKRRSVAAVLTVSALSSSDTLDVTIEGQDDGTNWYTIETFTQATGATTQRKTFVGARKIRAKYVLADAGGGGVTCTVSMTAEAV